jgi:hypothetical protein
MSAYREIFFSILLFFSIQAIVSPGKEERHPWKTYRFFRSAYWWLAGVLA